MKKPESCNHFCGRIIEPLMGVGKTSFGCPNNKHLEFTPAEIQAFLKWQKDADHDCWAWDGLEGDELANCKSFIDKVKSAGASD
jgi:hypothetical protein